NPVANPHSARDRAATYFALLLVNVVVAVALVIQIISFLSRARVTTGPAENTSGSPGRGWAGAAAMVWGLILLFQLGLFCYVYVTLKRYYVYPVVSLKLDSPAVKAAPDVNAPTGQGRSGETPDAPTGAGILDPSWT